MGEKRNAYWMLARKPEGKRPQRRPRRSGWTMLKWILDTMRWYGLDGSAQDGSCGHGNEPSDSIKCWKIPEYLSDS
jgi:hypothetical protein